MFILQEKLLVKAQILTDPYSPREIAYNAVLVVFDDLPCENNISFLRQVQSTPLPFKPSA